MDGDPARRDTRAERRKCFFDADVDQVARRIRKVLAQALPEVGLVDYPTEWWHWSYGDRYWALVAGADHAIYGPVESGAAVG